MSENDIRKLEGFPILKRLKSLLLNNNRIWYVGVWHKICVLYTAETDIFLLFLNIPYTLIMLYSFIFGINIQWVQSSSEKHVEWLDIWSSYAAKSRCPCEISQGHPINYPEETAAQQYCLHLTYITHCTPFQYVF